MWNGVYLRMLNCLKIINNKTKEFYYLLKYSFSSPGSVGWLIATEIKYGGFVTNVKRNKVSSRDPRTENEIRFRGMVGGDRMLRHGYAKKYSEYLLPYVHRGNSVTLVEVGILKGTGLAIWADLFSDVRVIGLDIDLDHVLRNMDNLVKIGAFKKNIPELYEYDQFFENTDYLKSILKEDKIDIFIDDGFHSNESILTTMKSVVPLLSESFVYIIEDNKEIYREIEIKYPELSVAAKGHLTIVCRK